METKVWCEQVYVKTSSFSSPGNLFDGAFANNPIKSGELVEKGLMRRLSDNKNRGFDGMENPFIFTWSDDIPNYTWAFGSGCVTFYNTVKDGAANTRVVRHFDEDRFGTSKGRWNPLYKQKVTYSLFIQGHQYLARVSGMYRNLRHHNPHISFFLFWVWNRFFP